MVEWLAHRPKRVVGGVAWAGLAAVAATLYMIPFVMFALGSHGDGNASVFTLAATIAAYVFVGWRLRLEWSTARVLVAFIVCAGSLAVGLMAAAAMMFSVPERAQQSLSVGMGAAAVLVWLVLGVSDMFRARQLEPLNVAAVTGAVAYALLVGVYVWAAPRAYAPNAEMNQYIRLAFGVALACLPAGALVAVGRPRETARL